LPTRGSSIYALATYAHEQGVPLKMVVAEPEYKFPGYKFKAYKKTEIELADRISTMFYTKAKEAGITIDENDFTLDSVKRLLTEGKVLLLRLIIGIVRGTKENKRNPHYLPVYGYSGGKFLIMDPRKGPMKVDEAVVEEAFDKVTEVKRDHRMIVFG
ncbi:MAG: peptidase C39 family protein, partial [Candidatus Woesearchaeota archaeon]